MKKIVLIAILAITNVSLMFSQYSNEALKYSYIVQGGTARASAMGTSINGLGADAGCLYFNPAGIGVYRKSEISITPNIEFGNSTARYLGKEGNDFKLGAGVNSFSAIASLKITDEDNLNFGLSVTNLNNFDNNIVLKGQNYDNSMTDYFAAKGNGIYYEQLDDYYSGLAWDSYLINETNSAATQFETAFNSYGNEQRQQIIRKGSQDEISIALGGSINRKIYLGATLGIQLIDYEEIKQYSETDIDNLIKDFNRFDLEENLLVDGAGVNFKAGFLVNPIEWLRIGASFHTPTFYSIKETYSTYMASEFDTISYKYYSPEGVFKYQLNSPFRANVSAGFIIGTRAAINLDYEYLNYGFAKLRSDFDELDADNDEIKNNFSHGHNLRLGAEYVLTDFMALRLGVAYYGSPYKKSLAAKNYTLCYSGGLGFKIGKSCFLDLSYTYYDLADDLYYIYNGYGVTSPLTTIKTNKNRINLTFGFRF